MSDLISRRDTIELLTSRILSYGDLDGTVSGVIELIKAMPSAEQERTAKAERSEPDGCYLCGGCGRQVEQIDSYCAECGVKLEWSE